MKFKWHKGLIWVSMDVMYEGKCFKISDCILDTGSASTAIDIDQIPFDFSKPTQLKRLVGVGGGTQEVLSQVVDKVILAGHDICDVSIEFGNLRGDMGINGFVGTDLLSQFKITINPFEEDIVLQR